MNIPIDKKRIMDFQKDMEWFKSKNILTLFEHLFFISLIAFCFAFYLERTIPFDAAFYSFKIIQLGKLNIENGRFGAVYNQLLPLFGLKQNCSLETFLRLYSISFAICNYIFFIIIRYVLKQRFVALAFIPAQILAYRYNFFYPVSEIHSAIGPLFLLLALLYSTDFSKTKKTYFICSLILLTLFWLANIHILSLTCIIFIIAFYLIDNRKLIFKPLMYVTFLIGILYFIYLIKVVPAGSYQAERMIGMEQIMTVVNHPEKVAAISFFFEEFLKNYILLATLLLVCSLIYIFKKQWLKLALLLVSITCLWVIIMASNINNNSPIVYQNYYALFGLFISIPLIIDILPLFRFKYSFPFFLIIIGVSMLKIVKSSIFYQEQIEYFQRTTDNLRSFKERKFVVNEANLDWTKIWVDWDISFQSLLISSIKHPDSAISFYTTSKMNEYDSIFDKNNTLIGVDFAPLWFTSDVLNKKYFNLRNTSYKKVNGSQDLIKNDSIFDKSSIKISCEPYYNLIHFTSRTIPIKILNNTPDTLFSTPGLKKQILLCYHLYDKNGKLILWDGIRSKFEMDIFPHSGISTGVQIDIRDLKRGDYIVDFDIVYENKQWFEINKRTRISIW